MQIPTLGFGPAHEKRVHTRDEFITIPELIDASRGFQGLILALGGNSFGRIEEVRVNKKNHLEKGWPLTYLVL